MRRLLHLVRKELLELRQDPRLFGDRHPRADRPADRAWLRGDDRREGRADRRSPTGSIRAQSRELVARFEASPNFTVVGIARLDRRDRSVAGARHGLDGAGHSRRTTPSGRCRPAASHAAGGRRRHRLELDDRRDGLRDERSSPPTPRTWRQRAGGRRRRAGYRCAHPRLVQPAAREPRLHDPGHRRAAAAGGDDQPVVDGDRSREGAGHARAAQRHAAARAGS